MVPRLRVWRWPTWRSASAKSGQCRAISGDSFEIALPHHGADAQPPVHHRNAAQVVDVAEIDQMIDDDVTEIHHRHERLPAGEDFGVGKRRQKLGRLLKLPRRVIVEGRRLH